MGQRIRKNLGALKAPPVIVVEGFGIPTYSDIFPQDGPLPVISRVITPLSYRGYNSSSN